MRVYRKLELRTRVKYLTSITEGNEETKGEGFEERSQEIDSETNRDCVELATVENGEGAIFVFEKADEVVLRNFQHRSPTVQNDHDASIPWSHESKPTFHESSAAPILVVNCKVTSKCLQTHDAWSPESSPKARSRMSRMKSDIPPTVPHRQNVPMLPHAGVGEENVTPKLLEDMHEGNMIDQPPIMPKRKRSTRDSKDSSKTEVSVISSTVPQLRSDVCHQRNIALKMPVDDCFHPQRPNFQRLLASLQGCRSSSNDSSPAASLYLQKVSVSELGGLAATRIRSNLNLDD